MANNIFNNNSDIKKIVILNSQSDKYNIKVYENNKTIIYCTESLLSITKYLHDKYNIESGTLIMNNYNNQFKNNSIKMQRVFYFEDSNKNKSINEIFNEITILTLYGIGNYIIGNQIFLVLEIKEYLNSIEKDTLETISSLITLEYSDISNIIFVQKISDHNINIVSINIKENEIHYGFAETVATEYYLYNFVKNYVKIINISINTNKRKVVMSCQNDEIFCLS
jgi:hypothetical protein